MTDFRSKQSIGQQALALAKEEIVNEKVTAAVKVLKDLYRKLDTAEVIVENIKREITDAEEAIEQGNA